MKRNELHTVLRKTGDLSSLMGIRSCELTDGRARGVRAYDLYNQSGLRATVFADRCLDIPLVSYKGHNIGFLSKSGVSSPFSYTYTPDGADCFLRQFPAGFMTTCGMTFSGATGPDGDQVLPLHGRVSNSIAENAAARCEWLDDEYVMHVSGSVREARLVEENMLLTRDLFMRTEADEIIVHDTVQNLGFTTQPVTQLYHVNFGYPILDSCAKLYFSADKITPLTEVAKAGLGKYNVIEEPSDVRPEECFYHTEQHDPENSFAMIWNPKLEIAVIVHYNSSQCPIMCQWKSRQCGDYALGLEPTTCGVQGRARARADGTLRFLEPGKSMHYDLRFEFTDDPARIGEYRKLCKEG